MSLDDLSFEIKGIDYNRLVYGDEFEVERNLRKAFGIDEFPYVLKSPNKSSLQELIKSGEQISFPTLENSQNETIFPPINELDYVFVPQNPLIGLIVQDRYSKPEGNLMHSQRLLGCRYDVSRNLEIVRLEPLEFTITLPSGSLREDLLRPEVMRESKIMFC